MVHGIKAMGLWEVTDYLIFCYVSSVLFILKDVE